MHDPYYILLVIVGFVGGMFGGLLGLGGGWLFGPSLNLLGLDAATTVGTSLMAMSVQSMVSASKYYRKGALEIKTGLAFGFPAVLGVEGGRRILAHLSALGHADSTLRLLYIGLLIAIIANMLQGSAGPAGGAPAVPKRPYYSYFLSGCLVGTTSGVLGVGGGILLVPILVRYFGFGMKRAVATSLMTIVMSSSIGASMNLWHDRVMALPAALLAFGALFGGYTGSSMAMAADEKFLKRLFCALAAITATSVGLKQWGQETAGMVLLFGGASIMGSIAIASTWTAMRRQAVTKN